MIFIMHLFFFFKFISSFYIFLVHPIPGSRIGFDRDGRLKPRIGRDNLVNVIMTEVEPKGNLQRNLNLNNGYAIRYNPIEKMFHTAPLQITEPNEQFIFYGVGKNRYLWGLDKWCVGVNIIGYLTLVECNDIQNRVVFEMEEGIIPYRSTSSNPPPNVGNGYLGNGSYGGVNAGDGSYAHGKNSYYAEDGDYTSYGNSGLPIGAHYAEKKNFCGKRCMGLK